MLIERAPSCRRTSARRRLYGAFACMPQIRGESPACRTNRRKISRPDDSTTEEDPSVTSRAAPVGLHRVLDPGRRAAAGRRAARHPPRAVARRGADPGRAAQPRRRVVPPARAQARRRTATRSAPRCSTSSRPAARCRTPRPAPAACSSAPSRRSARSRRSASRSGDRVATLVSLTLTPLVIEDGLAALGRPLASRCPATGTPILFGRSIAAVLPDDLPAELSPGGHGRLRRPGADRPGGGRVRRPGPSSP